MRLFPAFALAFALASTSGAAIRSEVVAYRHGEVPLQGELFWDDGAKGQRPGVLIVHQWMGPTDYERMRARQLVELGYVAFVADVYGKGVRPANANEAGALAGSYKADRTKLRGRVAAGLEALGSAGQADPRRLAAIGYCFGGTAVLELARSGAGVAGVVSFHGGLDSPSPADGRNIKARVLVLHGADDPFVPAADIAAFQQELRDARVDWQMVWYGGAVHSFTHADAGSDASKGAAYDEAADRRSWRAMRAFLEEVLR
ncbi:MAG: dienelactone hydrolase family protein [Acidobacteriota bacterium]